MGGHEELLARKGKWQAGLAGALWVCMVNGNWTAGSEDISGLHAKVKYKPGGGQGPGGVLSLLKVPLVLTVCCVAVSLSDAAVAGLIVNVCVFIQRITFFDKLR